MANAADLYDQQEVNAIVGDEVRKAVRAEREKIADKLARILPEFSFEDIIASIRSGAFTAPPPPGVLNEQDLSTYRNSDAPLGGHAEDIGADYFDPGPPEEQDDSCCPHCGKDLYEWSDYGCPYCDIRVWEET